MHLSPRSRRLVLAAAGLTAAALALTACAGGSTTSSTAATEATVTSAVTLPDGDYCAQIKSLWPQDMTGTTIDYYTGVGAPEDAQWKASFKPFEDCTGAKVQWDSSKEFEAQINVRIASGNAPDVAAVPQPGLLRSIVEETGSIKPATAAAAANVDRYYSPAIKQYGTVNDIYFGTPIDASVKSFIWYSPKRLQQDGYQVPQTYDDLMALTKQIAATGKKPWCAGAASGDATGWPLTDWLEDYMLRTNGPEVYQQWVNHEIPFNDPKVADALAKMGEILKNPDYVNGGLGDVASIASTNFQDAGQPILKGDCYFHRQASFYENFWPAGTTVAPDGDVYAMYFPTFNDNFGKPVLGAGTFLAAFNDKPEVQAFQYYLTTPEWSDAYAKEGPNITANNALDQSLITSPIAKLSYQTLQDPKAQFAFDGSDQMPGPVGANALWKQLINWITGQDD
ncbi:MAG TPA: ABC transporter substrate-binding protein, partial [Microlunatus sp.]|nr:ABC transporter substrate-binding protein [Microlunatus sp.]